MSSPLESLFASPQPSVSFIIQDGGISDYSSLAQQIPVQFRLKLLYQFSEIVIVFGGGSRGRKWLQVEHIRLMFSRFSFASWKIASN